MPTQNQINAFTKAFHLAAIQRLATEPELADLALETMQRWQRQRGPIASDPYLREWQVLLKGDLATLQERICADTEEAATLRNASPLGFVLTAAERQQLRTQSARPSA